MRREVDTDLDPHITHEHLIDSVSQEESQWAFFAGGGQADRHHPTNPVSIGSETETRARSIISARPRTWRAGSVITFGHPSPYRALRTTPNGRQRMAGAHPEPAERMSALRLSSTNRDRTNAMGAVGEGQSDDCTAIGKARAEATLFRTSNRRWGYTPSTTLVKLKA